MSMGGPEPAQMSRDELEKEVSDLRHRVTKLEDKSTTNTGVNHVFAALLGADADNYSESPFQFKSDAEALQNTLASVESRLQKLEDMAESEQTLSNDPNVSNWQCIVQKAHDLKDHPDHALPNARVALYRENIANAIDCTERHAQDLIEDYGGDRSSKKGKNGTDWRKNKTHTTSRKTESNDTQRKMLVVDLDVWGQER